MIVEANAAVGNYWFRATVQTTCSAYNAQALDIKGIVRYTGATSTGDPTTAAGIMTDDCLDEPLASLVPVVVKPITKINLSTAQDVQVGIEITTVFKWVLNGISAKIDWASPTLLRLLENQTYPNDYHVLSLPDANQVRTYLIRSSNRIKCFNIY